jgi:glycosyltransferase involved in cell wall biosynthesis
LNRPDHLQHALDSCLWQTVPVRVIVADQGHLDKTAKIVSRYKKHPWVRHLLTDATCIQENWNAAARACETEFFAWLQDDDYISQVYADKAISAFDAFPQALHWQASTYCMTADRIHAIRWGWAGPMLGVDMFRQWPEMFPGEFCVASMLHGSWGLSPGVAFRCGQEFSEALDAMPLHCDLFAERLILAQMGARGPGIADPVTAGYWVHHGANESYNQNADGSISRQTDAMVQNIDDLIDRVEDWDNALAMWCRFRSPLDTLKWLSDLGEDKGKNLPGNRSRHSEKIKAALRASLEGRVEVVPSQSPDNELAANRAELVWN